MARGKKYEHGGENANTLERGQTVKLRISALTPTGAGISKDFGRPIFVERVAPGDLAEIELFDVRKDFAKGKVVQLLESSPMRTQPPCPLFSVCGGCQWQHITYEGQLQSKTDIVKQSIEHTARLDPGLVKETIGAKSPLHYRNKVQFPVRNPRNSSRILAGYFKQDSHELVNIKYCPVQPAALDQMLEHVKVICEEHGIWAYDEEVKKGSLRHINARYSFDAKKILVTLVVNMKAKTEEDFRRSPLGTRLANVGEDIMAAQPDVTGVCINLNPEVGNRILGDATYCVAGVPYIEERLTSQREDYPELLRRGVNFKLSSPSFFQINTEQAVRLLEVVYDEAKELLAGIEKPVIVDAFAGVGTMSFWLSPLAARVIAIEEHGAAVDDGRENATLNQIDNVEFVHGTVEEVLERLRQEGIKPDLVVLDPPRKGLSADASAALLAYEVDKVLYVSCNPSTLARDLRILKEGVASEANSTRSGYKTRQIQPVDLFPQTYHVESVTTLEREVINGSVGDLETT